MRVPPSVRMVADIIGLEAAVRLTQAVGRNSAVYVPSSPIAPDHRLARILQPRELSALQSHYGGDFIPLPSARGIKRKVKAERRRLRILELSGEGMTPSAVALAVGCSRQYAERVIKRGATSSGWRKRKA